ncbi:MAG TPA: PEP-CTERM sorting domain-containing protein [Bryobacteraceae bacterium]|nr:PEP-CTERM sorting domain-containing protein [Bryobacteraceae bacterium]
MKKLFLSGCLSFFAMAGALSGAPVIGNWSFESPDLGGSGFMYNPALGAPWAFVGSGIAEAGPGGFFVPATPDGDQAAFIQGSGSSISQAVSGFDIGSVYTLAFYLAKRTDGCSNCGAEIGSLSIGVKVDGVEVFTPLNVGGLTPGFHQYTSNPFVATASTLTISFEGSGPAGDRTAFVDAVTAASAVPEPGTIAMGAIGMLALVAGRRMRR